MAKIKLYAAGIREDDADKVIDVDIFNLPYDRFDFDNPMWIMEDVDLGKSKNRQWPDLSNVAIAGTFDCSDFPITADTVLPFSFHTLICKHSISDLGVLIGRIPNKANEIEYTGNISVVVRPAILNNIKKDKDGALEIARKFAVAHPTVTVTDGKQTLQQIFDDIERAKSVQPKTTKPVPEKPTTPAKTSDWLSTDELADACVAHAESIASINRDVLRRYIQQARSDKARLPIRKQEMMQNGNKIVCVHRDDVKTIAEFVEMQIASNQERATKDTKKQKKDTASETKTDTAKNTEQKLCIGNKEIKPTKIKKFILDSVWKSIRAECGKNTTLLQQILMDIDVINIVPKKYSAGSVFYVQDGIVKSSNSLEYKSCRCICQGFETHKSSQRIVWGVSGTKLIAQYFFAQHDGEKNKMVYKNTIRDIDVDADFATAPDKYLSVSDLIAQFGGKDDTDKEPTPAPTPVAETKPTEKPVAATKPTPKPVKEKPVMPSVQSAVVAPVEKPQTTPARKPRIRVKVIGQVVPRKIRVITPQADSVPNTPTPDVEQTAPEWVDLYSLSAQITEKQQNVLAKKNEILSKLMHETDTSKALELNRALHRVLMRQKALDNMSKRAKEINDELRKIRDEITPQH